MCLVFHILYKGEFMRYYIYLDRMFIRTLFAVLDDFDFDIDVVEYAVRKSYTNNNEISVDPSFENGNSCDTFKEIEKPKNNTKKNNFSNERLRVGVDKEITYNIQTERKYINISDITDMKNISFYHKLVSSLEDLNNNKKDNRLYIEEGNIIMYDNNKEGNDNIISDNEGFFRINNTCIWYDKEIIKYDISKLSYMNCKVKVVGYILNDDKELKKVVKALAIFIE